MKRNSAFMLALSAAFIGSAAGYSFSGETAGAPYCPPGAKFCPAPGADNTVFLDTYFGMDAETGVVTAYSTNNRPQEPQNGPLRGEERVLFTSPPISVENRFVPSSAVQTGGRAAVSAAAYSAPPQYSQTAEASRPRTAQTRPLREAAESEVANQQASRADSQREVIANNRVPWYKGGVWRNRKSKDTSPGTSGSSRSASSSAADDMWDDDDDFNSYSSGGSQNYPAQQTFGGDPYAMPPQQQPFSTAGEQTNYAGEPYTLPNSPAPSSPYQPGYVYPGTDISYESTYQGGYQEQQPQYIIAPPQAMADPYAQSVQAVQMPPNDAAGSPQFENAIRMVKENRFSEAKNLLASETSRSPNNAAAWRWLADCHYNLLELNDAIGCYQRALDNDPNDYYALRGQGFAYLHRGHEYWRRMQQEVSQQQKDQAAATFAQAHDDYKRSLEMIGLCLRRAPNDGEAVYGEAMAAEGASRKLYSNVISYLRLGPEHRGRAERFAENCFIVINKGIQRSRERAEQMPNDTGPRALLAGLYLRKAMLYNQLDKTDMALLEISNARDVHQSILSQIDSNNATAQKGLRECEAYWKEWGGDMRN